MFDQIPVSLQHDVLVLLLFTDHGQVVQQLLPVESWASDPSIFHLAKAAYNFWENYNTCPKDQIYTMIDCDQAIHVDSKPLLHNLVHSLELKADIGIPYEWVVDKIKKFHRVSTLRRTVQEVIPFLGDAEKLDELEAKLAKGLTKTYESFDPGQNLLQGAEGLLEKILSGNANLDGLSFGIDSLTKKNLKAYRGTMTTFMASSGKGKTWFMVHMGKQGLKAGLNVTHVSLELSRDDVIERYLQSMYALYTLPPEIGADNRIKIDQGLFSMAHKTEGNTGYLYDADVISDTMLSLGRNSYFGKSNLNVKFFPTNTLTVNQLEAYLDGLYATSGFHTDVLIIDYPDLMQIKDSKNTRLEIGQIYREIRRIAGERNLILIVCTQSNRSGSEANRQEMKHMGEDISKYQTSDICLTWSATEFEQSIGVGRLFVAKARKASDSVECFISQNLTCGQFHMEDMILNSNTAAIFKDFRSKHDPSYKATP